jgi:hypothetical protein
MRKIPSVCDERRLGSCLAPPNRIRGGDPGDRGDRLVCLAEWQCINIWYIFVEIPRTRSGRGGSRSGGGTRQHEDAERQGEVADRQHEVAERRGEFVVRKIPPLCDERRFMSFLVPPNPS